MRLRLELYLYSQTTSKLKCVGSPCRIIYTVFGKPPVSLLKLFDYIYQFCMGFSMMKMNFAKVSTKYLYNICRFFQAA